MNLLVILVIMLLVFQLERTQAERTETLSQVQREPAMMYKVLFVEDEIMTREGIRDNVNWNANGFEYCGEASDGEMALPLIRTTKPDVLITDIKMPFMDGLQLSKIVRGSMPWIKIIILSGHDEFEYAQQAIQLGVSEYLLKPVTVQDMHSVLQKIALQLDREKQEKEKLKELQGQLEENRAMLRERFLLKVVTGAISSADAIEQGRSLDLDLIARCFLVILLKFELRDRSEQFDYEECQGLQKLISEQIRTNPDTLIIPKDWQELIVLMKGNTPQYLDEEQELLLGSVERELSKTRYRLIAGVGAQKSRIGDIYESFIEAVVRVQNALVLGKEDHPRVGGKVEFQRIDRSAVDHYLRCGVKDDFDVFFATHIRPIGEIALRLYTIKNYIFMDIVMAAAKLVGELGGDIDTVIPELATVEAILANIETIDQLEGYTYKIFSNALSFRDAQTGGQHIKTIRRAKEYIDEHYQDPDLSLDKIASQVTLSPSYFSMIFSQETCQTFKEYLTEVRIKKAKELLRTSLLNSADVSYAVGYNDPHYFSYVFKKTTGLSPTEYRSQGQVSPSR